MLGVGLGLLALVAVVDPNEPGHYPTCPWLFVTGTFCPGCGSLRMLHDLAHGDLAGAVAMNPFALAMLPVLVAYYAQWTWRTVAARPRSAPLPSWAAWAYLAAAVTFWIARNVPAMSWLAPG